MSGLQGGVPITMACVPIPLLSTSPHHGYNNDLVDPRVFFLLHPHPARVSHLFSKNAMPQNSISASHAAKASGSTLTYYPVYCFPASPVFNTWVKLTASDVHKLERRRGFEGARASLSCSTRNANVNICRASYILPP